MVVYPVAALAMTRALYLPVFAEDSPSEFGPDPWRT